MNLRTKELDIRVKCVEEIMKKKKENEKGAAQHCQSLPVSLACLARVALQCLLACCHAAPGQWKELPLRLICVMMTAK